MWSLTCLCPRRIRDSLLAQSLAVFLNLGGDSHFKAKNRSFKNIAEIMEGVIRVVQSTKL